MIWIMFSAIIGILTGFSLTFTGVTMGEPLFWSVLLLSGVVSYGLTLALLKD